MNIFWLCGVMVHFLGNGRKWCIWLDWRWVVVDIFWLVVGGGGYILDGGRWWWVGVGRGIV